MGNCLLFAFQQWWTHGGHLCWRASRHRWYIFHVMWSADLQTFEDFVPLHPKQNPWYRLVWFQGRHRRWTPPEPWY